MRKGKKRPISGSSHNADAGAKISILINSIYYFLDFVFIISEKDSYQLVVIHNGQLIGNREYKTIKATKIAFSRLYNANAWKKGLKPNWSVFYHPSAEWMRERMLVIEKGIQ